MSSCNKINLKEIIQINTKSYPSCFQKKFVMDLENLLNTKNNENKTMSIIAWKCYRCDLTFRNESQVIVHKDISRHPVRQIELISA